MGLMWPFPEDSIDEDDDGPEPLYRPLLPALLILLSLVLCGCSSPQKAPPAVLRWSDGSLGKFYGDLWLAEARTRFSDPVVLLCHGTTTTVHHRDGRTERIWTTAPDSPRHKLSLQQIAEVLHEVWPDRDLVYVCCNEDGHELTVPRAWYARSTVWALPDKYAGVAHETARGSGYVGSIWEFTSAGRVRLAGER